MKRKIIPVLIGCTLSFSALAAQPTAERYVVSFPEGTHVNYAGAFASAFPNGLPVGIGSGLLFTGKQGDALTFATITDRGPNADSPKEGKNETKIFVTPDFAPLLMTIRVQNGKAEAIDPRPLHDDKGAINGLPLASDVIGSTNEVAFSDTLHRLKGDNRGLDTEGITPDGKGGYWLCDEYGPFLINIDSKGKILAIHGPQAAEGEKAIAGGLPNILKWRQANRGFEGLTRMPDGRIIVAVQSTLDIDAKSKKKALFTRLVSFDPASGKTAMYGYPIDSAAYSKNSDAKIGDIVALDNQHILLIEQPINLRCSMPVRINRPPTPIPWYSGMTARGARMCINGESISPLKVARVNKICPTALPSYRASSDNAGRALSSSSKEATKSASLLKPNARVSTSRISLASLLSVI